MSRYDFIAIGGGSTGLAASYRISRAGRRVALVDKGPVGGLCSLAGCNPKKVLVRATEVLEDVRHAREHGIDVAVNAIDWRRVIARKRKFTEPVPAATEKSLADAGVDLIRGTARFISPDTLSVDGQELSADGFVIATGSTPRRLAFPGGELVKTSDDILDLERVPPDLVIIGAGIVAFEFGQVFARAGSRVTIVMPSDRALRAADSTMATAVVEHSKTLGISFLEKARVAGVSRREDCLAVDVEFAGARLELRADFVLNAAGRVPALEALDLGKAEIESDRNGVVVNEYLRSPRNRRVFAGGDAHGRRQLSPVASYEGRVVAKNFLEGDVERVMYDPIPQALYTVPPLAWVGMSEESARHAGIPAVVTMHDMSDWRIYAIAGERPARAKVVLDGAGRILGAHLFGAGAPDVIHVFAMAMRYGLTTADLEKMVWAYPTFTSVLDSTWR